MSDRALVAATLIVLGNVLGLIANRLSSKPLPILAPYQTRGPLPVVQLARARLWLQEGSALPVDARSLPEFQLGHPPGAILVSRQNLGRQRFNLAQARRLVVYGGSSLEVPWQLARLLDSSDLPPVYVLREGYEGLKAP